MPTATTIRMLEGGIYNRGEQYSQDRRYIAISKTTDDWKQIEEIRPTRHKPIDHFMVMHTIQERYRNWMRNHDYDNPTTQRVFSSNPIVRLSAQEGWHPAEYNYWKIETWKSSPTQLLRMLVEELHSSTSNQVGSYSTRLLAVRPPHAAWQIADPRASGWDAFAHEYANLRDLGWTMRSRQTLELDTEYGRDKTLLTELTTNIRSHYTIYVMKRKGTNE